jgi:DNA-directed RNA polymerase subunit K/omega
MDKRIPVHLDVIPRDIQSIYQKTGNIYHSLVVISRRADQVSQMQKEEIMDRLSDYLQPGENLDELAENREQIEISQEFERQPKPTVQAVDEFLVDAFDYRLNDPELNRSVGPHVDE